MPARRAVHFPGHALKPKDFRVPVRQIALDHDDFELIQSKIMNVIDSNKLELDAQISSRYLCKLDCAGKAAQRPTFPHPALRESNLAKAICRSST